nr:hypothetical protein [Tanacetum cinerariifolium]
MLKSLSVSMNLLEFFMSHAKEYACFLLSGPLHPFLTVPILTLTICLPLKLPKWCVTPFSMKGLPLNAAQSKVVPEPYQMVLAEMKLNFKKWETIISENSISLSGNKDHPNACLVYILYCLGIRKPFNLAYYMAKMMASVSKGRAKRIMIDGKMLYPQTPSGSSSSSLPTQTQCEIDSVDKYTLDLVVHIEQLPPIIEGESKEFKQTKGMFKCSEVKLCGELKLCYEVKLYGEVMLCDEGKLCHEPRWDYDPEKLLWCFGFITDDFLVRLFKANKKQNLRSANGNIKSFSTWMIDINHKEYKRFQTFVATVIWIQSQSHNHHRHILCGSHKNDCILILCGCQKGAKEFGDGADLRLKGLRQKESEVDKRDLTPSNMLRRHGKLVLSCKKVQVCFFTIRKIQRMRFSYRREGESQNVYNGIRRDANSTFWKPSHLVKLFLGPAGRLTSQGKLIDYISVPSTILYEGGQAAWVMGCAGFGYVVCLVALMQQLKQPHLKWSGHTRRR